MIEQQKSRERGVVGDESEWGWDLRVSESGRVGEGLSEWEWQSRGTTVNERRVRD